jgi:hypothetical protein
MLSLVRLGLFKRSDSFSFTNVKPEMSSFVSLRLLSRIDKVDLRAISFKSPLDKNPYYNHLQLQYRIDQLEHQYP